MALQDDAAGADAPKNQTEQAPSDSDESGNQSSDDKQGSKGEQTPNRSDDTTQDKQISPGHNTGHGPALQDGVSFDLPGWPSIGQYQFGGPIQIGVPVTGVISESMNFHRFTLTIPQGRNEFFGVTLTITANSDEFFEIYFAEYYYDNPWGSWWYDFYDQSDYVKIEGRTMTISYLGFFYPEGTFHWEFNCPEYQWGDGPDDPNQSDLKLHFSLFLDPDAENAQPDH